MANLLAWYPLHKDTKDWSGNGCTALSGTLVSGGLMGQCLEHSSPTTDLGLTANKMGKVATVAFWAKCFYSVARAAPFLGTSVDGGERNFDLFQYPKSGSFHFASHKDGKSLGWSKDIILPDNEWVHIVIVAHETGTKLYRNGDLIYTNNYRNYLESGTQNILFKSGQYQMNDLRLYAGELSLKTIKELAHGDIANFSFSEECNVTENIIHNPLLHGGSSVTNNFAWDKTLHADAISIGNWSNGYNGGVPSPTVGYHAMCVAGQGVEGGNCLLHINDNAKYGQANRWLGTAISVGNLDSLGFKIGDPITISWMQKVEQNAGGSLAGFNVGFYVYGTNGKRMWLPHKKTHRNKLNNTWEQHVYSSYIPASVNIKANLSIYFYGDYSAEGSRLYADKIQLERREWATGFSSIDLMNQDIVGGGAIGQLKLNQAPVWKKDSTAPKGGGYYHFPTVNRDETTNDDGREMIFTDAKHGDGFTLNVWARHGTLPSGDRYPLASYNNQQFIKSGITGDLWFGIQNNRFQMHGWGSKDPTVSLATNDNEWHLFTARFSYQSKTVSLFVDGVKLVNSYNFHETDSFNNPPANKWTIGGHPRAYSDYFHESFMGDIAGWRLSGGLMSDDDIKALYHTAASLSKSGELRASSIKELSWEKVYNHDLTQTKQWWSGNELFEPVGLNPNDVKYSRLGDLDQYRNGQDELTFKLVYPEHDIEIIWKQQNNINESTARGFKLIKFPAGKDASRFGAMKLSDYPNGCIAEACTYSTNWFYALGSKVSHGLGIPALAPSEPSSVLHVELYVLRNGFEISEGKEHTNINKQGIVSSRAIIENNFKPTLLDYSTWRIGDTQASGFGRNGGADENKIVIDKNPQGELDVMWQTPSNNTGSDADGGFVTSHFNIDKTKAYRYCIWIRRNVTGNGSMYWGCYGNDSANKTALESLGGSANSNPYFYSGAAPSEHNNEWMLFVAYIYPAGTTKETFTDDGIYLADGTKIKSGLTPYRWGANAVTGRARSYLYYSTDVNTVQSFYKPRVEAMDGSEMPLEDILNGCDHVPLIHSYSNGVEYDGEFGAKKHGAFVSQSFIEV